MQTLASACNMHLQTCSVLPPPISSASSLSYQPLPLPHLPSAVKHLLIWAPLPPSSLLCKTQLVSTQSSEALEVKEETEGRGVEGREGEGWVSVELVGRSGAAPPVIIRVTAARARLCAACTRRDVLPREKSEHLSVPPRRQQPPTSLSNSTQLVTRSPNSYFLSLTHNHSELLCTSFPVSLTPSFTDTSSHSLLLGQVVKAAGLLVLCRLQKRVHAIFGLNFMWAQCQCT